MTFASPSVLALLAVLLPFIVVLHTLRREEHATASLFLWRKVASSRGGTRNRRTVPWRSPALWLHLAIATITVLALAGPRPGQANAADHVVVLLDASRTMRTADVEPTRFDAAVAWLVDTWGRSSDGPMVSFLLVGDEVKVLAARQRPGQDVVDLVKAVEAEDTTPAWQEALDAARSLALPSESTRWLIVTDGSTNASIDVALQEPYETAGLDVERYEIGGPFVNVGVANVDVRSRGASSDRWTVSGEVRTVGLQRGDVVRVQVFFRPIGSETSLPWSGLEVDIDRDGRGSFELPIDLPGDGVLEVRTSGRDQQPADDVARRVLDAEAASTRVAIVGPDDAALRAALRAVGGLEVRRFDEVSDPGVMASFDLVIVTGEIRQPIATSVFWYGSVPPTFVADSDLQDATPMTAAPMTAAPGHPLMRDVDAREMGIRSARILELPVGAEPLVAMEGDVLAWGRTTNTGRQVAFGFGPEESVWASQVSFPLFMASLVDWVRSTDGTGVASCSVGDACRLPSVAYAGAWELIDADGDTVASAAPLKPAEDPFAASVWPPGAFDRAFSPKRAGLYELRTRDGSTQWVAVDAPLANAAVTTSMADGAVPRMPPNAVRSTVLVWRWLAGSLAVLLVADALAAWRSSRTSLSARSRSGRVSAVWASGLLSVAILLAFAAAALVPSLGWTAAATKVVLRSAPAEASASRRFAQQVRDRWLGWRTVDMLVGTAATSAAMDGLWPAVSTLERGIALTVGIHRSGGPLLLDARDLRLQDVTTEEAAALLRRADDDRETIALWPDLRARPGHGDAILHRVDVPHAARAGGAFELVATFASQERPTVLEVVDEAGRVVATRDVPAGLASARLTLQAEDAGWTTYTVHLRSGPEGSTQPTLDETTVAVNVADPLDVLFVASRDDDGALLQGALEAQRIDVSRVTPNRIPATLERLTEHDAVVLVDVQASDVHPFHQEMLQRFVRDEGGGLVVLGGTRSFGPGGYYSTLLDDISPLSSRIEEDTPEVSMTFVLDRSGSMDAAEGTSTRMELAKLATFEAIRLLGDRSQAALVAFDSEATTLLPLRSTADLEPFRNALRSVAAAGGTSIYPALVHAYDIVAASDAATRHVIVMTDGLSEEGDFASILESIVALGVKTSFVGVGDAASRGQLARLAGHGGGSLHFTNDARALPGILAQEALMLSADPIEERSTQPVWVEGAPPPFLGNGDGDGTTLTTLLGYVRTTPKDEATVILEDATSQDPLLATWRYGLGRVAAFTSEADGPWSGAWTQDEDYATFWSELARWSAMTVPGEPYRLDVSAHEAVADIVLDVAPDRDLRYAPVARLVEEASGDVVTSVVMRRASSGRWTARLSLPVADGALYVVRVLPASGDAIAEPIEHAFVHSPQAWSRESALDVVSLTSIADGLERANEASRSPSSRPGRLAVVAPDVAWRGSPRNWLAGVLALFVLALTARFGGLSLRRSRAS